MAVHGGGFPTRGPTPALSRVERRSFTGGKAAFADRPEISGFRNFLGKPAEFVPFKIAGTEPREDMVRLREVMNSDLHGLPIAMGNDCRLGKDSAQNLNVLSREGEVKSLGLGLSHVSALTAPAAASSPTSTSGDARRHMVGLPCGPPPCHREPH